MQVKDYIARNGIRTPTISSTQTIGALARYLQQEKIGAVVVSDNRKTIDGIISERDIAYSLADRRGELHLLPVSALMTRRVVTCKPEDSLLKVLHLMKEHHIRHVPVVNGAGLIGLLTLRDLVQYRLDVIEKRTELAMLLHGEGD